MKNITIVMIMFALIVFHDLSAQDDDARDNLSFGLKAGFNYSNIYDSKTESVEAEGKVGLAAGMFLGIPIGKFIGIQPEILFSQRGFKATGQVLGNRYSFNRTTNFIDVPILFAFKPIKELTILAGPQYSFLINREDSFTNAVTSIEVQQEFKNENIRKNILCFTGGADITVKHFVLGARVGWDIQNNNGDGSSSTPRYKNVWYQATVGFRLY